LVEDEYSEPISAEVLFRQKKISNKILCFPFAVEAYPSGVIYLEQNSRSTPFSVSHLEFLSSFVKPINLILEKMVDFQIRKKKVQQFEGLLFKGKSQAFQRLESLIEKVKSGLYLWRKWNRQRACGSSHSSKRKKKKRQICSC